MGNASLKQHYDTASKTGVLQLSDQKLKEIPLEVFRLSEVLRNLDLSKNRIPNLSEDICKLKLLKQLKVDSNKIESLPNELGKLKKLELFNAANNSISQLPQSFSLLINMKQLYLCNNKLKTFPTVILGLTNLDVVDLSRNKITEIPNGMDNLFAVELNLSQNELSKLGNDLHQAPRLKILRVEENCLCLDAISPSLLGDSKIHTLSVEGNLFENRDLGSIEGYDKYTERYTSVKKKLF